MSRMGITTGPVTVEEGKGLCGCGKRAVASITIKQIQSPLCFECGSAVVAALEMRLRMEEIWPAVQNAV